MHKEKKRFIIIEPFFGGSHKQLIDIVFQECADKELHVFEAKKWPWRARTAALTLSMLIPPITKYDDESSICVKEKSFQADNCEVGCDFKQPAAATETVLFSSSVLNLAELMALRPDLSTLRKIVYWHENQLQYPVRAQKERDFQFGYNQILSGLVADVNIFNSQYNLDSFLHSIPSFLKLIPDHRPNSSQIVESIRSKSVVLYFPIHVPDVLAVKHLNPTYEIANLPSTDQTKCLNVVWPHRWEHDKDPDTFFEVMQALHDEGLHFKIFVLGEHYEDKPAVFNEAKLNLEKHIEHWGYIESKRDYYNVLKQCHVVVSTAKHEFFGVAMLEAVICGCYPLAPNRLVYPEHFPTECLYNTTAQLKKKLRRFSKHPDKIIRPQIDFSRYTWDTLQSSYYRVLGISTTCS